MASLAVALLAAACSTSSSAPDASASAPPASTAAESVFASPLYGYAATLTTAWSTIPATDLWDTDEPIGHDDPTVDQLISPQIENRCEHLFRCGPIGWAVSRATTESLEAVAADMDALEDRDHDCPAVPESNEPTEIDGESALLATTHCPEGAEDGGLQILRAITIHDGTAYYFWMQDPAHEAALEPSVRADFEALLAAVDLP